MDGGRRVPSASARRPDRPLTERSPMRDQLHPCAPRHVAYRRRRAANLVACLCPTGPALRHRGHRAHADALDGRNRVDEQRLDLARPRLLDHLKRLVAQQNLAC